MYQGDLSDDDEQMDFEAFAQILETEPIIQEKTRRRGSNRKRKNAPSNVSVSAVSKRKKVVESDKGLTSTQKKAPPIQLTHEPGDVTELPNRDDVIHKQKKRNIRALETKDVTFLTKLSSSSKSEMILSEGSSEMNEGVHPNIPKTNKPIRLKRIENHDSSSKPLRNVSSQPIIVPFDSTELVRPGNSIESLDKITEKIDKNMRNTDGEDDSLIVIGKDVFSREKNKGITIQKKSIMELVSELSDNPKEESFVRSLTGDSDGYTILYGSTDHGPQKRGSGNEDSSKVYKIDGTNSLSFMAKKHYVLPEEKEVSFEKPLLGSAIQGPLKILRTDIKSQLLIEDGELTGCIEAGSNEVRPIEELTETERSFQLHGNQLGSGQSLLEISKVANVSNKKKKEELDEVCGEEEECSDEAIDLTIDTIKNAGVISGYHGNSPPNTQSAGILAQQFLFRLCDDCPDINEMLGQAKYMNHFGMPVDEIGTPSFYGNLEVRTRKDEEDHMREPTGKERPCVNGNACEGMSIGNNGFILVSYPNLTDSSYFRLKGVYPENSPARTCVLCSRAAMLKEYLEISSQCRSFTAASNAYSNKYKTNTKSTSSKSCDISGDCEDEDEQLSSSGIHIGPAPTPVMITDYTNHLGPGEYSPDDCISISSSNVYKGVPGCFVVHSLFMYSVITENKKRKIIQHYTKPLDVIPFKEPSDMSGNCLHYPSNRFILFNLSEIDNSDIQNPDFRRQGKIGDMDFGQHHVEDRHAVGLSNPVTRFIDSLWIFNSDRKSQTRQSSQGTERLVEGEIVSLLSKAKQSTTSTSSGCSESSLGVEEKLREKILLVTTQQDMVKK